MTNSATISFAVFCRYAEVYGDNVTIIGTFNRIQVQLPSTPQIGVAVSAHVHPRYVGKECTLAVVIANPDGSDFGNLTAQATITNDRLITCCVNPKFVFNAPGIYMARVTFEGEILSTFPLEVIAG